MACDHSRSNASSFGDIAGATAVYTHADWILGITGDGGPMGRDATIAMISTPVPEPTTYALFLSGALVLAWTARRRRSTSPLR
jgi:hypothetical protein